MRVRVYLRIAKNGYKYKVDAGMKENQMPLYLAEYRGEKKFLPTVAFAVDFVVDDSLFSNASRVIGEIDVKKQEASVLGALLVPAINKAINEAKKNPKKK